MHYKKILFTRGAQHFHPYKKRAIGSHMVHHGMGHRMHHHNNQALDHHLLSLIKGVSLNSHKSHKLPPPKLFNRQHRSTSSTKRGGALHFTR